MKQHWLTLSAILLSRGLSIPLKAAALIILPLVFLSPQVQADGWICRTNDGHLDLKVFHHIELEYKQDTAAVMILSDTRVGRGRKTIARFRDTNATLRNNGMTYIADVDLRYKDSGRAGEYLLGTRLGEILTITLLLEDYSAANPPADGESLNGIIYAVMRDRRDPIRADAECTRYLSDSEEVNY